MFQSDDDYGVVVGGPSENRHLKFGKPYEEFVETMRDKMASKFSYGHFLLPLFNNLEDPLKSPKLTNRPKKDMSITDEDERKMHWELESKEWRKRKESLEETMKKVYLGIWGQCTNTLQNLIETDNQYESKKFEQDPVYLLKTI